MILNANNNQYIIREDKKMSMSKACRKQKFGLLKRSYNVYYIILFSLKIR